MNVLTPLFLSLILFLTSNSEAQILPEYREVNLRKINTQRLLRLKRPLKFTTSERQQANDIYAQTLHKSYKHSGFRGEVICPTNDYYLGTEWKTLMLSKPHRKVLMSGGIKYIAISISKEGDKAYCSMRVW